MQLKKEELKTLIYNYSNKGCQKAEKKLNKIHSITGTVNVNILFKDKLIINI